MNDRDFKIYDFIRQISASLDGNNTHKRSFDDIHKFPLIKGKQCMYVIDWKQSQIIYMRGVKEMLGYNNNEFNMQMTMSDIHPDDLKFMYRIIKGVIEHSISNVVSVQDHYLNVTYRIKKKDGSYLKVFRKSSFFETDHKGRLVSNFNVLTDISFISNNNKVEWDVYTGNLDLYKFKQQVNKEFIDFFTNREKEIIKHLQDGSNTKSIAEHLCLSEHTVKSHRKNILKKSRCHNVLELLEFCNKNGIL